MDASISCQAPHSCPLGGDYWPDSVQLESISSEDPVWGIADTHAHMMAHLSFGGKFLWGQPDGPIEHALAPCHPQHQLFGLNRAGLVDGIHRNGGYPDFRGWPTYKTRNHQQMYVDWIRRAYQGGLRLMVSFALDNQLLARITGSPITNDKTIVIQQLAETKAFVNRHEDFMQIAYSPQQARSIIRENRLAVILGVEVDSVGIGRTDTARQRTYWLQQLFYEFGVRHIFPIHLADNTFGGAAVYSDLFDFVNFQANAKAFELAAPADQKIDFLLGSGFSGCALNFLRFIIGMERPDRSLRGHTNARGLTPLARGELLPTLMRLGMVIDVDHMSSRSISEMLDIAESHHYPVIAGHAGIRDLALTHSQSTLPHRFANEYCRSTSEIKRIAKLGGITAIGLNQGDVKTFSGANIDNNCAGSSRSFAQSYLFASHLANGKSVALGSDMNGLAGSPGPRFGAYAASALRGDRKRSHLRSRQCAEQTSAICYEGTHASQLTVRDHPPLSQSVSGTRAFNLNYDGVAHYGMLPDFLQDLRNIGLTSHQLNPLFRSAEAYIRLWERCVLSKLA